MAAMAELILVGRTLGKVKNEFERCAPGVEILGLDPGLRGHRLARRLDSASALLVVGNQWWERLLAIATGWEGNPGGGIYYLDTGQVHFVLKASSAKRVEEMVRRFRLEQEYARRSS